jgi:hypothetical protein
VVLHCHSKNSRVLKKYSCRFLSTLALSSVTDALVLSSSSWVLQLLQTLSQCYNVRCFLIAPTVMTGFLTCMDFVIGSSLWVSCSEKTIVVENERLIAYYDDRLTSYESQFHAYRTWLDEDALSSMWIFLHSRYEPIGQSTFLATIYQEQLLC